MTCFTFLDSLSDRQPMGVHFKYDYTNTNSVIWINFILTIIPCRQNIWSTLEAHSYHWKRSKLTNSVQFSLVLAKWTDTMLRLAQTVTLSCRWVYVIMIVTDDNKKHLKIVGPIHHCEPPHAHSADVASGTVARRLRIDVDDNNDDNDNAWQRGPLWPHGMGPMR